MVCVGAYAPTHTIFAPILFWRLYAASMDNKKTLL